MKVDLKEGQAIVLPAKGKSFDPTRIPKAVKDAGFTAADIELTVTGTLAEKAGGLRLETPGSLHSVVLSGGAKVAELKGKKDLFGKRLRITGRFIIADAGQLSALTVEMWEAVPVR